MSVDHRKLSFREDWPVIPYTTLILIGLAVSAYDFIILQGSRVQLYPIIIGVALVIVGGCIRAISRVTPKRAGFEVTDSARLRVIEKQKMSPMAYMDTLGILCTWEKQYETSASLLPCTACMV